MTAEYFITMGVLFVGYCILRWAYTDYRLLPPLPRKPIEMTGKGLDTGELSNLVKRVRDEIKEHTIPPGDSSFSRSERLQNKREEIAKLAFFQKPPSSPPEPQDPGHPLDFILV